MGRISQEYLRAFEAPEDGKITFTKYAPGKNSRMSRWQRIKFWIQRRRLYQWYVWKRYGKKVVITRLIK
jgi:hypothetical protein